KHESYESQDIVEPVKKEKKKRKTKSLFFVFGTLLVNELAVKARMDKNSFVGLKIENISFAFNRTRSEVIGMAISGEVLETTDTGQQQASKKIDLKLQHSGMVTISKLKLEFNYGTETNTDYVSLFGVGIENLSINEFWFKADKQSNVH